MSYRVVKNKNVYDVVEKGDDLVVFTATKEKDARDMCRSLNLGSGFDGFTPPFFVELFATK